MYIYIISENHVAYKIMYILTIQLESPQMTIK